MARFSALLALCVAITTTAVSASPIVVRDSPISLPFARRFKFSGASKIIEQDRARARVLKNVAHGKGADWGLKLKRADVLVTNGETSYTLDVGVGTPPTNYTLLIDTGSANTVVGTGRPYVKTSSSHDTGNSVSVSYGSGGFSGEEYTDTVTLSPELVISNQGIAVATSSVGFDGLDGILGIGPTELTGGTVSDGSLVPTVLDNAYAQGLVDQDVIGISFAPASSADPSGLLTFGGVDESRTAGPINYVSITGISPASQYVGIDQSITYGRHTLVLPQTAGITDTGSTLLLLATDAFEAYKNATGAVEDANTGLLRITLDQYEMLESLLFRIGDETYEFIPNAQIWPRSLNTDIGGDADEIYLIVGDLGSPSGEGLDFINGYAWLERFYHVYDAGNQAVGIALTEHTFSRDN
ncbi:transporter [Ganoderma sinense ZZ0214-1]|uniref:Transporter n=1 Tax=Ganoderma sinense ZZ0214-1 TaxID=1077348 RepID=A0A2G8S3S6_9APHY|nr:transporter [Ganoderma sinense ZZ0214-1]